MRHAVGASCHITKCCCQYLKTARSAQDAFAPLPSLCVLHYAVCLARSKKVSQSRACYRRSWILDILRSPVDTWSCASEATRVSKTFLRGIFPLTKRRYIALHHKQPQCFLTVSNLAKSLLFTPAKSRLVSQQETQGNTALGCQFRNFNRTLNVQGLFKFV